MVLFGQSCCIQAEVVVFGKGNTIQYSFGFIAQLVEHCTGIAEVTGSNPAEA